jgi:hypothetical protein
MKSKKLIIMSAIKKLKLLDLMLFYYFNLSESKKSKNKKCLKTLNMCIDLAAQVNNVLHEIKDRYEEENGGK